MAWHHDSTVMQVLTDVLLVVHGYSLLRTQLNNDYFHDIFNEAEKFDVHLEAHRTCIIYHSLPLICDGTLDRHGDWPGSLRDGARIYDSSSRGRQCPPIQVSRQELGDEIWYHAKLHGKALGRCKVVFPTVILISYVILVIISCPGAVGLCKIA